MIGSLNQILNKLEWHIEKTARQHDYHTLYLLRSIPDFVLWDVPRGSFLGFSDLPSSKSFNTSSSTVFSPLIADSLSVEDAMFSFFDIETAFILSS